jgi:ubiE/COQ5 methyltransferase family
MAPPAEMSGQHETARQQSRAAWGAVARGWYAQREELWKASRPVSEWMVRKLDPKPGDTVLELAAGLADTGLTAARLVGESGRAIVTDFTPEMLAAARQRAEELACTTRSLGYSMPSEWTWGRIAWTASSSPVLRALSPEVQNTVREQVHQAARPFQSGGDTTSRPYVLTP